MKIFYTWLFVLSFFSTTIFSQADPDCIHFFMENETARPGELVCLDVTVESFDNILGMQFSIHYDSTQLTLENVISKDVNGLVENSFGLPLRGGLPEGTITLVWIQPNLTPLTLADETVLFELCFRVKDISDPFAPVYFSDTPTDIEITDGIEKTVVNANFIGGGVRISNTDDFPVPLSFSPDCVGELGCTPSGEGFAPTLNSGTNPIRYDWFNELGFLSNEEQLENITQGVYTLRLRDFSQQDIRSTFVFGDRAFFLSPKIEQIDCATGSLGEIEIADIAGGSGNFTYEWSNGSTEPLIQNLEAGTYSVTIEDLNSGCKRGEQFVIEEQECDQTEIDCVSLFIENDAARAGELVCVDITVESFDNILGMQFGINYDTAQLNFESIEIGDLPDLTIVNFGLPGEIFDHEGLITMSWFELGLDPVTLNDGTIIFSVCFRVEEDADRFMPIYFTDDPVEVEIFDGEQQFPDNINMIGGGVRLRTNRTVPPLTFSPDCIGDVGCVPSQESYVPTINSGTSPFIFNWSDEFGNTSNDSVLANVINGTYNLVLQDGSDQEIISLIKIGNPPFGISGRAQSIFCGLFNTGSVTILGVNGGSGSYNYLWSNGATTSEITGLQPGEYSVTVTDIVSGCKQTETYEVLGEACNTDIIQGNLAYECVNSETDNFTIWSIDRLRGGTPPYAFQWQQGTITGNEATFITANEVQENIQVQITDAAGKTWTRVSQPKSCELINTPVLSLNKILAQQGQSRPLTINGDNLQNIIGIDWVINWDSTWLNYINISLLGTLNQGILSEQVTQSANEYEFSIRFQESKSFNNAAMLAGLEYEILADMNSTEVKFDILNTKVILDDYRIVRPFLEDGRVSIRAPYELKLKIETTSIEPGDTACIAITAENFTNITSLQYALDWDISQLQLVELKPGVFPLTGENLELWNIATPQNNSLRFVGQSNFGTTLTDDQIHYELCFRARSQQGNAIINVREDILITEASNTSLQIVPVVYDFPPISIDTFASKPALSLTNGTIKVGEEIDILINAKDFEGIDLLDFSVTWDTSIVSLSKIVEGTISDIPFNTIGINTIDPGRLQVNWDKNQAVSFEESGIFLILGFVGKKTGISPVSFVPNVIVRQNNNLINPIITNGSVEVIEEPIQGDSLVLWFESDTVPQQFSLCTPLRANNFQNIAGLQYTHHWDPSILELTSVKPLDLPGISTTNFGLNTDTELGILRVSWTSSNTQTGVTLPDNTALYELCFTPIGDVGTESPIFLDGNPLSIEIIRAPSFEMIPLKNIPATISISNDFVWPGDTDHDGIANHYDLLNIGIGFGVEGPMRAMPGILEWLPLKAEDWGNQTPTSNTNYKHIDADGNGIINAIDTSGITINWGETTPWYVPEPEKPEELRLNDGVPLFVETIEHTGEEKIALNIILGTEEEPAQDVYGLAFSIEYGFGGIDVDMIYADFSNSWIGQEGVDLLAIQRNDPQNQKIDIALTRIDGQNISGSGPIAKLHVTIEDIILLNQQNDDKFINFNIIDVRLIDVTEQQKETGPLSSTVLLAGQATNIKELGKAFNVEVYPNPASNWLMIDGSNVEVKQIEMLDLNGALIRKTPYTNRLAVQQLENGTYLLRLITDEGVIYKQIMIQH